MAYFKFSADRLYDGTQFLENKVLITDADGTIVDLIAKAEAGDDIQQLKGILTPGLINAHCHLELSHLKDVIPPHTGLINFLCSVVTKRGFEPAIIQEKIKQAEAEMFNNGIVAVGDIGNTADTASVKKTSKIYWQNFVEVLSFTNEKATESVQHYTNVKNELNQALSQSTTTFRSSLVPHAPYSISPDTFTQINELTKGEIISIHNQEHLAENHLYQKGDGEYLRFFKIFGIEKSPFPITGQTSLQSILPYFNNGQTIFLVHNTSTTEQDIIWANDYAHKFGIKLVYCICINANLYIENKVPPIDLLLKHNCQIVLGTDSYSSNWQLSIASEIHSIQKYFPHISLDKILGWATQSAANALAWNNSLGSFKKGTKPGLTLLDIENGTSKKLK
jgi:cytosine/adenosine deaminase-related metal-dependent hydrolase